MAVISKADLLTKIITLVGDDKGDDSIALLEDVSDTFDDMESKSKDQTDWKKKYEENDASWRQKYRDRFFEGGTKDREDHQDEDNNGGAGKPEEPELKTKFDELFEKGE